MSTETKTDFPKIRKLLRRDRVLVTGIFKKAIEELHDQSVKSLISSKKTANKKSKNTKESTEEEFGKAIIDVAVAILTGSLDIFDEDFGAWFADLLGMSIEEFNNAPMNIESYVISQIMEAPEAVDFFTQCFRHAKLTELLERPLKAMRDKFGSILESEKKSSENSDT